MGLISFLSQGCPLLSILFIEEAILSPVCVLDTFIEVQLPMLFPRIFFAVSGLVYIEITSFPEEETSDPCLASDETQSSAAFG